MSQFIAVGYEWVHFSASGHLFHYTTENLVRVLIFTVATPTAAAVVVMLKRWVAQVAVASGHHRHTRELMREQMRLQSLVQSLPLGLLMVDGARNVVLSNLKVSDILRHPPAELAHPSCERMFYESRQGFMPADLPLARALAGKAVISEEVLYLRGDNTMVSLRMSAAAVRGEDGEMIGAAMTVEDITGEKSGRQAAQELAALVSASDDAIYGISKDGLILSWNRGAERLLGYTADEARYMNVQALMPPDSEWERQSFLRATRTGEHPDPFSTILVSKNGSTIPVSIRMSPVLGMTRTEIVGASIIARALEEASCFRNAICAA